MCPIAAVLKAHTRTSFMVVVYTYIGQHRAYPDGFSWRLHNLILLTLQVSLHSWKR
jgi:hypothetical protein